jgi:general transcription factor 3C polypeptide 2
MEEAKDNLCIATLFNLKDKKKKKKKKTTTKANKKGKSVADDVSATAPNDDGCDANPSISLLDLSVENFFEYIDTVAKLCGEEERDATVEDSEIKRMFSSVIFLRYA